MSSSLYIVATDRIEADVATLREADVVLALTSIAMLELQRHGITFRVAEDYYRWDNVGLETPAMMSEASAFLSEIDALVAPLVGYARPFSANGYWFLVRLCDLQYLHALASRMTDEHDEIHIISDVVISPLADPVVDCRSLNLSTVGSGLSHALSILCTLTDAHVHSRLPVQCFPTSGWRRESWLSLLFRSPEIVYRHAKVMVNRMRHAVSRKKGRFLVAQGGYEVEIFRRNCPDYEFLFPMQVLTNAAENLPPSIDVDKLLSAVHGRIELFFMVHMPKLGPWLTRLFTAYLQAVVVRIPSICVVFSTYLRQNRTNALLFSKGAETLFEGLLCEAAAKQGVPVFFFKHGGVENLFVNHAERDRYFERNPDIVRTQFLHSTVEMGLYQGAEAVSPVVVGRMERLDSKLPRGRGRRARILYSVGAPAHANYKDMLGNISDAECWRFASLLVAECVRLNIGLDIKPHPSEWDVGRRFFERLLEVSGASPGGIRLLQGGAIERLLPAYGAVVFDALRTRVLSAALTLDLPTILYMPQRLDLNPATLPDLENRVYRVSAPVELGPLLTAFREGRLASRWSDGFIEKYYGSGSPGLTLAHVRRLVCTHGEAVRA